MAGYLVAGYTSKSYSIARSIKTDYLVVGHTVSYSLASSALVRYALTAFHVGGYISVLCSSPTGQSGYCPKQVFQGFLSAHAWEAAIYQVNIY